MGTRRPARKRTVVVTGIASRFGRMLTRSLHDTFHIIGIDPRGARLMPQNVTVHAVDVRRRQAEDIFRRNRVDAVVHLGRATQRRVVERHSNAVSEAMRVLDFCQKHDVAQVVVLSSANIYGASPDNSQFLTEDAPLLAGQRYPMLRDHVEVDMYASTFFWRHPEIDTVILRPVSMVGRIDTPASLYLRQRVVPTILGYDPMMQLVSPDDVIHAIRLALKPGVRGIFNLAGPGPAPLSEIVRRLGHRALPLPEPLVRRAIAASSRTRLARVPRAELDYLKFVCMVDDQRARAELRYAPTRSLSDTLAPLRT